MMEEAKEAGKKSTNAPIIAGRRSEQIVESLLAKPSKKPDFASVMLAHNQPDILKRAQAFLPAFI